jgi:hypothetical protein
MPLAKVEVSFDRWISFDIHHLSDLSSLVSESVVVMWHIIVSYQFRAAAKLHDHGSA